MHTVAWLSWIGLVMGVSLTTTNPYALAIVLLCILLVNVLAPRTGTAVAGFRSLLLLGTGLCVISVLVAVVNGNYGNHILFTIPGPQVPWWLGGLRIGGPVSAEGLVAAAVRGIASSACSSPSRVFNGAVSPHRVLRTTPAALFHAGLVVTVGLTLLPSSIEDVRRIREMRALRGAGTGVRSLPALVVPAVIGGLERSMRLAEAMEARGYGTAPAQPRRCACSAPWPHRSCWPAQVPTTTTPQCGRLRSRSRFSAWPRSQAGCGGRRVAPHHEPPLGAALPPRRRISRSPPSASRFSPSSGRARAW